MLGDFDGPHTLAWARFFAARGHEVHAVSFYPPREELSGVRYHVLRQRGVPARAPAVAGPRGLKDRLPPSLMRAVHYLRYRRAGLRRAIESIAPDVFHAHYAVEHGFYGTAAAFHPYAVSVWGSDLLVESRQPPGGAIARWTLRRADLVTCNDASLAKRVRELGAAEGRVVVANLGIERLFLDAGERSVNLKGGGGPLTAISDRALEPLYNVDVVLRAFAIARARLPEARLLIAHEGGERTRLETLARALRVEDAVTFLGRLAPQALAEALAAAHVYVSVPSSDSMALSNLEAMAAGAFPVLADLPSVDGWVEHGVQGLRVRPRDAAGLADALYAALTDAGLRQKAAERNRAKVAAQGLRERTLLAVERRFYALAGRQLAAAGEGI